MSSFSAAPPPDPLIGWQPFDMEKPGDGANGNIWDFATDGGVSTVAAPDFVAGFEYLFMFIDLGNPTGTVALNWQGWKSVDAAWSPAVKVMDYSWINNKDVGSAVMQFHMPMVAQKVSFVSIDGVPSEIYDSSAVQIIERAKFVGSYAFNHGTIKMLKRQEYVSA
jgi:hypothetical protein